VGNQCRPLTTKKNLCASNSKKFIHKTCRRLRHERVLRVSISEASPQPPYKTDHLPDQTDGLGPQTQLHSQPQVRNPNASSCSRTCSNKIKIDFHFNDFTHNKQKKIEIIQEKNQKQGEKKR